MPVEVLTGENYLISVPLFLVEEGGVSDIKFTKVKVKVAQ